MEFRASNVAAEQNELTLKYLTKNLSNPEAGRRAFDDLVSELGSAVESFPDWHPILTAPDNDSPYDVSSLSEIPAYRGIDHTREFVRGFVTCPYSEDRADRIVEAVNKIPVLSAYRLDVPLYADNAYPVVVEALEIDLEADGTIRSRDAITFFAEKVVKEMRTAQVAETWWNIRSLILGRPHGARSSLFVNQHAGLHMRKILEALNNSGVYGPIKESSLEMLSQKKRDTICETLIQAALKARDESKGSDEFEFELRGETCKASVRETWEDGEELSVRVIIGNFDLYVTGFYTKKGEQLSFQEPTGKRRLAEKFL